MSEQLPSPRISRRSLLRGGAAAAVGLPLAACTAGSDDTSATSPTATTPPSTGRPPRAGRANVHVSHDHYGVHIEPSVAADPRHSRQLLAACHACGQHPRWPRHVR